MQVWYDAKADYVQRSVGHSKRKRHGRCTQDLDTWVDMHGSRYRNLSGDLNHSVLHVCRVRVWLSWLVSIFVLWRVTRNGQLFRYAVSPFERPVPCDDDSIKQPFKNNTVRMKQLLAVSLGTPFFIICFVEAIIFRHAQVR